MNSISFTIALGKLGKKGELTEDKAQKLSNLGIDLNTLLSGDRGWSESFEKLCAFVNSCDVLQKNGKAECVKHCN